jgi:hypothetical protein
MSVRIQRRSKIRMSQQGLRGLDRLSYFREQRCVRMSKRPPRHIALSSIPTAPTIHLPDEWTVNENARGQKGADRNNDPVLSIFPRRG